MAKEQYNFRLAPHVHKKLKILAAENGKYIGEIIEDLVCFFEQENQKIDSQDEGENV
ncbi:MAG: hypothetical protein R6V39_05310 [Desulfovibrionales bacterium]